MGERLTGKQERFVAGLVAGLNQREAYVAAYDARRMKRATIDKRASEMALSEPIKRRFAELVAESAKAACWSRERAIRDLLEVRDIALGHIRQTAGNRAHYDDSNKRDLADLPANAVKLVVSSTAELNKLCGLYDSPDGPGGGVTIIDNIPRPSDG